MEEKTVKRRGGSLALCRCPVCGAWHVKGKKKGSEKGGADAWTTGK
ncbi:MAG: hypothetical protein QXR87_04970 [Candidatus Hadarchaeales archaeon]